MPIIELDSVDSTNNYAMQLIDADKAQHALTITARSQTDGKGQRGRAWVDAPGQSLLMSIIITPRTPISQQFVFNATIAVAIANVLQKLYEGWDVRIKWPNDIIINDKKAGGILIENVLRGSSWTHSVIGLGLNIMQYSFPADLPYATSLKIASGKDFDITGIRNSIRENILFAATNPATIQAGMIKYNEYLYKSGQKQNFSDNSGIWTGSILHVNPDGTLSIQKEDGTIASYYHGQIIWEWGNDR